VAAPGANQVDGGVARDARQPGADVLGRALAQGDRCRGEGVLQRVLGVLVGPDDADADGQQAVTVALVEDGERAVVARAEALGEAPVGP
jgi:hypothetical protein